jgi:glycosyltransferase involved in cell wall biosynthesis
MTDPRVAVVIPCYNDGVLAAEAVASVQEAEPVEIVVVDDGSIEPATITKLAELEQQGVRIIRRPNGGLGKARMTGVAETSARYVYPLDADDRLVPGALAAMADILDTRSDVSFVWGDYELFGDQSGRYRAPAEWLPWTLTFVNPYPVCSLFRRDVIESTGGWQAPPAYEDWDLWLRLAGLGLKGVSAGRVIYLRRLHGDSRMLTGARRGHQERYAQIQERNAALFARRSQLRAEESPAVWKPLVYPIIFGARKVIPVSVEAFLQRCMMRLGTGLPG